MVRVRKRGKERVCSEGSGEVKERDKLPQQQQHARQPRRGGSGWSAVIFSEKKKREKKEGMGDGKGRG